MDLEDESAVDALEQHGPKRLKLGAASHEAMRDLSGMAMIAMKATSYEGHECWETHAKKNGRDRAYEKGQERQSAVSASEVT